MKLLRTAAVTDTGRKRRRNEDAFVLSPPLFAVADGMGGAQAGEIASRLAVDAMAEPADGSGEARVAALVRAANRRVFERSAEDAAVSGMGTTMTAALVGDDGRVAIGHVGDSRAYLLRDGRLSQLTDDHSLVAELVRTGRLSVEEAETHPQRSVITRALGTDPEVEVDTFTVEARRGDLFLLCSDGLTSMVHDEEIAAIVEEHRPDLDRAAEALVRAANRGGGEDNITVVFFEVGDPAEDDGGDTATLPSLGPAELDEDTLTEADRVPAVDTMVVPPEQVHEAVTAVPPPRNDLDGPARRVLATLTLVLLVALAVALLVWALSR